MKLFVAEPNSTATGQEQDVLLEVKHLNVFYQSGNVPVHAVNDVSLKLHRGQILGLAGESGSGKSTLAYAITRLLRPPALITGGEILYYPRSSQDQTDTLRVTGLPKGSQPLRVSKNGKREHINDGNGRSEDEEQPIDLLQL